MLIQLRQTEIIAALTMYIRNQGINLNGKTVDVTFTAGRKESGISADIDINDTEVEIPGINYFPTEEPNLKLVTGEPVKEEPVVEEQEPVQEEAEQVAEEAAEAAPTKTLFGS